jgi:hypothetical protein
LRPEIDFALDWEDVPPEWALEDYRVRSDVDLDATLEVEEPEPQPA